MKKKTKQNPPSESPKENSTSALEKLAHDFRGFDEQETICQKKNDGTD
jgi:hypothetical protein